MHNPRQRPKHCPFPFSGVQGILGRTKSIIIVNAGCGEGAEVHGLFPHMRQRFQGVS
jgi:hypothetical protein